MVVISVLMLVSSSAHAEGLSGWYDFVQGTARERQDGERTSKRDSLNHNLYLNYRDSITSMLSYQLNLRTNISDLNVTDSTGDTTTTYRRALEPALDILFGSPVYDLSAGYRRLENWDTAHINSEGRETTEFYYSRFNAAPHALPSLNIQFDSQRHFDYGDNREIDTTNTAYSVGSSYTLPSDAVRARYTINFSRIEDRTPLNEVTNKTITDNFSGSYSLGYSGNFWRRMADYSVNYRGNYSRNKTRQFVVQAGTVVNERIPLGGFYAQGTPIQNDVDVLSSQGDLVDGSLTASTGIGISALLTERFQNIGVLVSSQRAVDRLFIYVNQDIAAESTLTSAANWKVYRSNFNQAGTWTEVAINSIGITVDNANNEFRYEIEFSSPQNASFFKAINLQVSSIPAVEVTEIEAYGTDTADDEAQTTVESRFNQGLSMNAALRAMTGLTFSVNYSLNRRDQNPLSVERSIGGMFENVFSDSVSGDKENFSSDITRDYGASAIWLTHRLLTTSLRAQRSESFDNNKDTDVRSDTYHLSFNSVPLQTLDATLSLIRNDSYTFSEKNSTSDSLLLSVGSKLHRDVNMITDLSYIRTESLQSEVTTTTRQISGTVDAVLTRKLSGTVSYDIARESSQETSVDSRRGTMIMTYRPGRFININGNFTISDFDGDLTTSEGILFDWLPLQAVRLNVNYQHTDSEPGPVTTDAVGGYVIWYAARFADVRVTYAYTMQQEAAVETDSYNVNTNINCRF